MEGIEIIRYQPLLQSAFAYIVKNSNSNYLPYHNLNHLLTVLKYSDYIAREEGIYYDRLLPLHLAALFHDVNHSGGELPDSKNIKNAKDAFHQFCNMYGLDENLRAEVDSIIEATEFPYTFPNSNITKFQEIIRDADMMQQFEYNWINQTTLGMAKESKTEIEVFIPRQRHFLESIIFLTKSANAFKKKNWRKIMDEFRILEVCMGLNK
jgi:hypothetical protein